MAGTQFRDTLVANGAVRALTRLMLEGRHASASADTALAADTAAWALSYIATNNQEVMLCHQMCMFGAHVSLCLGVKLRCTLPLSSHAVSYSADEYISLGF